MASYVVDANLLTLWVVGSTQRDLVERHRRLSDFSVADYDRLAGALNDADQIFTTPNALTEMSNLVSYGRSGDRARLVDAMRRLIAECVEVVVPSIDAVRRPEFAWLGLSDVALLDVCTRTRPLLTADRMLFLAAASDDPASALYFVQSQPINT